MTGRNATSQHIPARTQHISRVGMIAATYAALTLIVTLFLSGLAWGPIQFRLSEALCVLALFTPDAIPGLTLGCALANIVNIALSGTGTLGLLDVVFGSLATLLGATFTWHFHDKPKLALVGPVLFNALIVPAYLPLMLTALGFTTIPFTSISLSESYILVYLFGAMTVGIGEAVVMYALGMPLYHALAKTSLSDRLCSTPTGAERGPKV